MKKALGPDRRRTVVDEVRKRYVVNERRACQTLAFPRSSQRYQSVRHDRADLRLRPRDRAASRPGYGYRRLHILPSTTALRTRKEITSGNRAVA